MKKVMSLCLTLCISGLPILRAQSQEGRKVEELSELKQRVAELESQNRKMLQLLGEIQIRLDKLHEGALQPGLTIAAPTPPAQIDPKASLSPAVFHPEPKTAAQAAEPPRDKEPVLWPDLLDKESRIKLYGFLRLDFDIDSQRPNVGQTPFFITSPDPKSGAKAGNFSLHPRLTRFGVDYTGSKVAGLDDGKLSGKLELDFENGGSESRQIIRIRHAYFKMNWKDFSILGGQTWDIFSPLFPTPNNDVLMWWAGNVGDRRPQLRAAYEPRTDKGQWSLTGAVGLTGAVDPVDLDGDGYRDGEVSRRPNIQSRLGYSQKFWTKNQAAAFGVSGFYGWMRTIKPIAGRTDFHLQGVNFDYVLPVTEHIELTGENWWGRNMSDFRGGSGQGVINGREIRDRGGWSELKLTLSRYWAMSSGFTIDDPVDADIPVGGRVRNRAAYLANRFTPGSKFLIGIDYLRWKTNFKGPQPGIDNRFNIFLQYGY